VLDLLMVGLLIAGFAAAVGYVHACVSVTQPVNVATGTKPPGTKPTGTKPTGTKPTDRKQ
jgi:hypothetical protein